MFNTFVAQFTEQKLDYVTEYRKRMYMADPALRSLPERVKREAFCMGLYLGEVKRGVFTPSLALLQILSTMTTRKVHLNETGAWLFICGRDVMAESIVRADCRHGLVLVQNKHDENLGLGKIINRLEAKGKIVIKNQIDLGDFLRREN